MPVLWAPERVRTLLGAQGHVTHSLIGVGEADWVWLPGELDAVAEPLANVLNKRPVTRAAAAASDEAALAIGLAGYVMRSTRERVAVLRARAAQPDEPIVHPPRGPIVTPPPTVEGEPLEEVPEWQVP